MKGFLLLMVARSPVIILVQENRHSINTVWLFFHKIRSSQGRNFFVTLKWKWSNRYLEMFWRAFYFSIYKMKMLRQRSSLIHCVQPKWVWRGIGIVESSVPPCTKFTTYSFSVRLTLSTHRDCSWVLFHHCLVESIYETQTLQNYEPC